jgi:hypothetical protein
MTGWEALTRELALPHEWQLGGGGGAVWAPPAPVDLDRPGFRDEAYVFGRPVAPVFAVSLLDARGRFTPLQAASRRWNPARLELEYLNADVRILERRALTGADAFISQFSLSHPFESAREYWLVLWTRRPADASSACLDVEANPRGISFLEARRGPGGDEIARWGCALGASLDADSWTVERTAEPGVRLDWPHTPFADQMGRSGLPGAAPRSEPDPGWLWFALAYPVAVPPGDRLKVSFVASFASDVDAARAGLEKTASLVDPIHAAEEDWIAWFEESPSLECSDPYIQRAYWRRLAARRIWRCARRPSEDPSPAVDAAVETAWRIDEQDLADDLLRLLLEPRRTVDAPLGILLRRVAAIHRNSELVDALPSRLDSVTDALACESERTARSAAPADSRLRRVAMKLDLALALENLFRPMSPSVDASNLVAVAASLKAQLHSNFWNDEAGWFLDEIELDGRPTPVQSLHGLLPLLADAVDPGRRESMLARLVDPEYFRTPLPLPGVARREAAFRPDRPEAPADSWTAGRVCPLLCSLVVEAVGRHIETASPCDRFVLAEMIRAMTAATFVDGDLERPTFYDHYHPLTGRGSAMLGPSPPRGWLNDHLIRFLAGLRPDESGGLIVDPLPFGLQWFRLDRVAVADHEIAVEWDSRAGLTLTLDDRPAGHAPVGRSIAARLADAPSPQAAPVP